MQVESQAMFGEAKRHFPGGVNSPARVLRQRPFYVDRAKGARLHTVEGRELVDYCLAFGPMIIGHAHPEVRDATVGQLEKGWLYGVGSEPELALARAIKRHMPSMQMLRFVNSGTEATMNAIKVARGYTKRNKVLKFEGNYHGSFDAVLVKAGSSALTHGVPTSDGVPLDASRHTLVVPYNDLTSAEAVARANADDLAAVIVEPVAVNMGLVLPERGFLEGLRELCSRYGALLIMDEVVTGFRLDLGGAQGHFGVRPDLTTLGKVIGGGFPIGAFGGAEEFMRVVAPSGKVHNAGTFNAHPVSMVAGLKTIEIIRWDDVISKAASSAKELARVLDGAARQSNVDAVTNQISSMFQIFFTKRQIRSLCDVECSDTERFWKYHQMMRDRGVYWAPSQFETCFTSSAHTKEDLELTADAIADVLGEVGRA